MCTYCTCYIPEVVKPVCAPKVCVDEPVTFVYQHCARPSVCLLDQEMATTIGWEDIWVSHDVHCAGNPTTCTIASLSPPQMAAEIAADQYQHQHRHQCQ